MARAPLQINVIPFRKNKKGEIEFAVFHRSDNSMWHFVSGGAEDDESTLDAAIRELREEAGIKEVSNLFKLDSKASIPKSAYPSVTHWPKNLYVLPQFSFAVNISEHKITLSEEHDKFRWLAYDEAKDLLKWDSDKVALWELNERLKHKSIEGT
jgi:dATP pyrophosphohydrolase